MSAQAFAAALIGAEQALDWERLGQLYCAEGGEYFFPPEQREAIREVGLRLADDVATALERLPAEGARRSLYVGAGVAELAPLLCEHLVLGRQVVARTRLSAEAKLLRRALDRAAAAAGLGPLPAPEYGSVTDVDGPFDHLWLVSVLDDPETFPALSSELYGRGRPRRRAVEHDRRLADDLVRTAFHRLTTPAVVTTTDEELAVVEPIAREQGWELAVPEAARLSGVVGDPVRVCSAVLRTDRERP